MKKTNKIIILALALVVFLGGCAKVVEEEKKVEKEVIKIGLSSPMTGDAASYGEAFLGGAELAVKEINDAGGINGSNIKLVIEDDQCSSEGALAFNKLINIDQVTAIVGPLCSSAAGSGLPIAQKAGIPTIVVGSAPELTNVGDYIFRNYPSDNFQGKFAAEFVMNSLKKKKVAIIYENDDWGQGLKNVFTSHFQGLGGEVVFSDGILSDSTDIRTSITKAKNANPDILYFPVRSNIGTIGLKQIKEMGLDVTIIGGDSFTAEEMENTKEADGVLYTVAKVNNLENFQNKVKEVVGKSSNSFTPYSYDAIKILPEQ